MKTQINFNNLLTFSITYRDLISIIIMILISILIMILVPLISFAQDVQHQSTYQTPIYNISISDPYGYMTRKEKWIAKREAKKRHNLGDQPANQFRQTMTDLSMFQTIVDQAAFDMLKEEQACGRDISRLSLNKIHIVIEDDIFQVDGTWAAGVDYDDGRIRIVWWHLSQVLGVQSATPLLRGELRQLIYWWLTGRSRELWGVENICN